MYITRTVSYTHLTSHDTSTKFNDFSTYYIPDSILIIGDKKDPEYWKDENAPVSYTHLDVYKRQP